MTELFIEQFLQQTQQYLLTSERTSPMATEIDVQQFINDVQDEVPSADRVMAPEDEYPMFVKPGSTKIITDVGEKGRWAMYTAQVVIDDASVRELTNLEQPSARVAFFLDITEASTDERVVLAKGANRNTRLGQLLKATNSDKAGWKYGDIEGVPFKGKLIHKTDKRDPNRVNAEVVAFARA